MAAAAAAEAEQEQEGGGSDADDSSDDDFEVPADVEQRIMQLEAQLEASPKDYDAHVQVGAPASRPAALHGPVAAPVVLVCDEPHTRTSYCPHACVPTPLPLVCAPMACPLDRCSCRLLQLIAALKQARLHVRLRAARERMQGLFPLDESMWLDWVNDSMASMADSGDVDYIKQLFQLAAQDYLSVTLLASHLQ